MNQQEYINHLKKMTATELLEERQRVDEAFIQALLWKEENLTQEKDRLIKEKLMLQDKAKGKKRKKMVK